MNSTIVTYCNTGTQEADSVQVHVKMPEYVVLGRSNTPYTVDKDHNYIFTVGKLAPDQCGNIQLFDSVVCDIPTIRGLTQCTKVWITPANARIPSAEWDGSDIFLKANCQENEKVRFAVFNKGRQDMADSSTFRVFLNDRLAFSSWYRLTKGDSLILSVPANGNTIRFEADQRPGHPRKQQSNVTIEACGTGNGGTVSKGFVSLFPQDDIEPEVAIECLPIVDSYDPNDKAVSPGGITPDRYTPGNQPLDYLIRFQNTGTDVAYKVIVTDTLSEHIDIASLQMGASSHPYRMSVTGKGRPVLTFTFNNINLPDSTKDKAGSNGFIQFNVRPKDNLPVRIRIENFADIYFDYNEPIRTNTTLNTIYDIPPVIEEAVRLSQSVVCTTTNIEADAGTNLLLCGKDSAGLQAVQPGHGTGRWRRISGTGVIQNAASPTATVTGLAEGENVFEWSIPANDCGSDSLRARVTVTRLSKPAIPSIAPLGDNELMCSTAGSSYEWFLEGSKLDWQTRTVQVTQAGLYQVRVAGISGCTSDLSETYNYKLPCLTTNTSIEAGTNRLLCEQDSVRLQAKAPQFNSGRWKIISGAGFIQEATTPTTLLTRLGYGENVFEWSIPSNSCGSDSLKARITITRLKKPATPMITQTGADSLFCSQASQAYEWYLNGSLLGEQTQMIRVHQAGTYTVRVKSQTACISEPAPAFAYVLTGTEPAIAALINFYPNPTTGKITLILPPDLGSDITISVSDAVGRSVLVKKINPVPTQNKAELDLSNQQAGIFIIRLQTRYGIITRRVFKTVSK